MKIKETARHEVESFMPPVHLTNTIYQKLGMTFPVSEEVLTKPRKFLSFLSGGRFKTGLFSSIISTAITAVAMFLILYTGTSKNETLFTRGQSKPLNQLSRSLNSQAPVVENKAHKTLINQTSYHVPVVISSNQELVKRIPETVALITKASGYYGFKQVQRDKDKRATRIDNSLFSNDLFFDSPRKNGLTIEIRGASAWNMPQPLMAPSKLASFNNMSVTVFYDLSPKFIFGADLRQEDFLHRIYWHRKRWLRL